MREVKLKCPKCGQDNQEGAKFCNSCGTALAQSVQVETPTLSAAEKTRIVEEEQAKIKAAEEDKKAAQKKKGRKNAFIGCGAILAIIIIVAIIIGVSSGNKKDTTTTLNAAVSFTGTQFVITNSDSFDWTNVKLELNSPGIFTDGYIYNADLIQANNTYTVGAAQLVKPRRHDI